MYFLGPNVKQRFVHTLAGAVFAVAAWLALSYGLGIYFQRFANFNRTYGALGGAIALMTWLYWSSFVILLGAEINGEVLQASGDGTLPLKQTPPEKVKPKTAPGYCGVSRAGASMRLPTPTFAKRGRMWTTCIAIRAGHLE